MSRNKVIKVLDKVLNVLIVVIIIALILYRLFISLTYKKWKNRARKE